MFEMLLGFLLLGVAVVLMVGIVAVPFYLFDLAKTKLNKFRLDADMQRWKDMEIVRPKQTETELTNEDASILKKIYDDCTKTFSTMHITDLTLQNKVFEESLKSHGYAMDSGTAAGIRKLNKEEAIR